MPFLYDVTQISQLGIIGRVTFRFIIDYDPRQDLYLAESGEVKAAFRREQLLIAEIQALPPRTQLIPHAES